MSFESAQARYDSMVPDSYFWEAWPCAQTGISCEDCELHDGHCPEPDEDWSGPMDESEWTYNDGTPYLTEEDEDYEAVEDFDKAGDR